MTDKDTFRISNNFRCAKRACSVKRRCYLPQAFVNLSAHDSETL